MTKHTYNLQTFYNEDAISYYLLGAFITDGCIYVRKTRPNTKIVSISSADRDWMEIINRYISPNKPILITKENCFTLQLSSTELANWLELNGCYPRKSLTVKFPIIPEQYLIDFIRGCWDGDGSLSFTKSGNGGKNYQSQGNLTSGSLAFCQAMRDHLIKLNIACKIYKHGRSERLIDGRSLKPSNAWRVVISSGLDVYKLVKLIYERPIIVMPRKANVANLIISHHEKKFFCIKCGGELLILANGYKKQYCNQCLRLHRNERQRELYNAK
jgi:hypothetical protein